MVRVMTQSAKPLDSLFQALADPTRRAVVARLGRGEAPVKELAQPFDMALPSFLQHLGVLEGAGLIESRKEGRVRTCSLRPDALAAAERWFAEQRAMWEGRYDNLDALLVQMQETPDDT